MNSINIIFSKISLLRWGWLYLLLLVGQRGLAQLTQVGGQMNILANTTVRVSTDVTNTVWHHLKLRHSDHHWQHHQRLRGDAHRRRHLPIERPLDQCRYVFRRHFQRGVPGRGQQYPHFRRRGLL